MKGRSTFFFVALLLISIAGVNAQLFSKDLSADFEDSDAGRAFMQAYTALKSSYLNDVDDTTVIEGAIEGMIVSLDDRFTSYRTPEEAARENNDRGGSFFGIGVLLSPRDRAERKIIEVINVYRDGPAYIAGIKRGDIFAEVDGTNVEDFTSDEIIKLVRGDKGTTVILGMRRPGQETLEYFEVVRDEIEIINVESTVLPQNVGYLHIRQFGTSVVHDQMVEQLADLEAKGATSLILDLRDNPGGLLPQGVLVADEFLSEGDIVYQRVRGVSQRYAAADEHQATFANNPIPMVVLINENSASASEIVAAALQENARAKVIGTKSFGKGVGQSVMPLENGGQFVFTSFEWLTPNRKSIHEEGVTPDIIAEDDRFGNIIALEGQGAAIGETIEFVVNGEVIGSVEANEEGEFKFIQSIPRGEYSDVQGEALVNLEEDNSLRIAYNEVLKLVNN